MQPRIWQSGTSYTIQTSDGYLYALHKSGKGLITKPCGKAGVSYSGAGKLCKTIPNEVKTKFFELQKQ